MLDICQNCRTLDYRKYYAILNNNSLEGVNRPAIGEKGNRRGDF